MKFIIYNLFHIARQSTRDRRKVGANKYLDVMREALNKGNDKQSYYWRAHRSLNGWCSMNYPSTISNPMLKRRPNPLKPERREVQHSQDRVRRPFTAITAKGKRVADPLPINHNYYKATKAELLHISDSDNEQSEGESVKQHTHSNNYVSEAYDLGTYHAPIPIRNQVTAYTIMRENSMLPGTSKNNSVPPALGFDYTKKSAGMLTTTSYEDKVNIVNALNQKSQYLSPLVPMNAYCGEKPNPMKDPFDRRKVKQLDDISFETDGEIEEHKNYRRLPETILTEENLKIQLSSDLKALNLNNHYWLKNNFIDKIGRMAPNLVELSIRGLQVTSDVFIDLVKHMGLLKILDISNCKLLEEKAIIKLADTNQGIVRFKASM